MEYNEKSRMLRNQSMQIFNGIIYDLTVLRCILYFYESMIHRGVEYDELTTLKM